jgi:hypothetical protein
MRSLSAVNRTTAAVFRDRQDVQRGLEVEVEIGAAEFVPWGARTNRTVWRCGVQRENAV